MVRRQRNCSEECSFNDVYHDLVAVLGGKSLSSSVKEVMEESSPYIFTDLDDAKKYLLLKESGGDERMIKIASDSSYLCLFSCIYNAFNNKVRIILAGGEDIHLLDVTKKFVDYVSHLDDKAGKTGEQRATYDGYTTCHVYSYLRLLKEQKVVTSFKIFKSEKVNLAKVLNDLMGVDKDKRVEECQVALLCGYAQTTDTRRHTLRRLASYREKYSKYNFSDSTLRKKLNRAYWRDNAINLLRGKVCCKDDAFKSSFNNTVTRGEIVAEVER